MKILVTGATGYIGERLVKLAVAEGHTVVAATRRPMTGADAWLPFDLDNAVAPKVPADIEAIFHLAVDLKRLGGDEQRATAAAGALIAAATHIGARFVFVSSQTARPDAPTPYGRTKWRIEQEVLAAGGVVARLGQVYGGSERGLFGTLVQLIRRLPLLPAFVPAPSVQPIHVDDCARALLILGDYTLSQPRLYCLAASHTVSFTTFLGLIARQRVRVRRIFVPVPVLFLKLVSALLGARLSAALGLQQLNSLFGLRPMTTAADVEALDLQLRDLRSSLHRSGNDRRRRLIQEGNALLAYVLRCKPRPALVRRYVRAIEALRSGKPLALPALCGRWPSALALLEGRSLPPPRKAEFDWRVHAATVIAEASGQGAARFLGASQSNRQLAAFSNMALAVVAELTARVLRIVLPLNLLMTRASRRGDE